MIVKVWERLLLTSSVQVRNVAKHPKMYESTQNKEYPAPNLNWAVVEKHHLSVSVGSDVNK